MSELYGIDISASSWSAVSIRAAAPPITVELILSVVRDMEERAGSAPMSVVSPKVFDAYYRKWTGNAKQRRVLRRKAYRKLLDE